MSVLRGKRILLGVCGSIAAFKAVALASQLNQAEAEVTTILTRDAARFVTPLSFTSVTQRPAHIDLFTPDPGRILHIALAEEADLLALDKAGVLYIFELKRWESNQENILQVMRYGQIFGRYTYKHLENLVKRRGKLDGCLKEKHKEYFDLDKELSDLDFNNSVNSFKRRWRHIP